MDKQFLSTIKEKNSIEN